MGADDIKPPKIESAETPRYSEEETLALDEPQYELLSRGQSALVPQIVHDFYRPENQTIEGMERFLSMYGLNGEVYDPQKNPQGIISPEIRTIKSPEFEAHKRTRVRAALLALWSVKKELQENFFGMFAYKKSRARDERFSDAFYRTLEHVRQKQNMYPLSHRAQFPRVDAHLREIEESTGLRSEQIFERGHVPTIRGKTKAGHPLELVLHAYALLVSGKYTRAEVAQQTGIGINSIQNWLARKKIKIFSEEAVRIAREKHL